MHCYLLEFLFNYTNALYKSTHQFLAISLNCAENNIFFFNSNKDTCILLAWHPNEYDAIGPLIVTLLCLNEFTENLLT